MPAKFFVFFFLGITDLLNLTVHTSATVKFLFSLIAMRKPVRMFSVEILAVK